MRLTHPIAGVPPLPAADGVLEGLIPEQAQALSRPRRPTRSAPHTSATTPDQPWVRRPHNPDLQPRFCDACRSGPEDTMPQNAPMDEPLIVNVANAPAFCHPRRATVIVLEPEDAEWPDTGVNIQIMQPGQPNCRYHSEPVQEDFLVLHGECIAIVNGEEKQLKRWDFLHCSAGTEHVFVGAGDGPCAVLMTGSRREYAPHYPVNEMAARYDASVQKATDDRAEAYADWRQEPWLRTETPWPPAD
jgi:uncharacterized cupin superfamily protein